MVFDILYSGDSSVIHQPLRERQQLLQKSVHPIKGRLELLLPESRGLNENRPPGRVNLLFYNFLWHVKQFSSWYFLLGELHLSSTVAVMHCFIILALNSWMWLLILEQLLHDRMKPSKYDCSLFIHRDPLIHILTFSAGEPQWSILASSAEEVQKFFQETVDNRSILCVPGVLYISLSAWW